MTVMTERARQYTIRRMNDAGAGIVTEGERAGGGIFHRAVLLYSGPVGI